MGDRKERLMDRKKEEEQEMWRNRKKKDMGGTIRQDRKGKVTAKSSEEEEVD